MTKDQLDTLKRATRFMQHLHEFVAELVGSVDVPDYLIVIASPLKSAFAISPVWWPDNSSTAPFWLVSPIARA